MQKQNSSRLAPPQYVDPKQSITIYTSQSIPQSQPLQPDLQKSQVYYVTAKPKSPIKIISQTPLVENKNQGKIALQSQQQEVKSNVQEEIWEKKYQLLMESYQNVIAIQKKENNEHEKFKMKYQKLKEEMDLFGPIEQKVNALIDDNQYLKAELQNATNNWKNASTDKDILQQAYIQLNQEKNKQDDNIQKLKDYLEIKDKELMECKKRHQEFEIIEIEDMNKRASEYEETLAAKQKEINEFKLKMQKISDQQFQDLKKQAQLEEAVILLGAENERLHGIQKEKFKENDQLKKKIFALEKSITDLKIEMQNQQGNDEQTVGLKNELDCSYQTVAAFQSEINTYKIKYQEMMRISSEKDQWHEQIVELESEIEHKNYEIDQLKLKLLQCENKVEDQKKSLSTLYEFENKLDKLVTENQRLQVITNTKNEQISTLNTKNQTLEKKLKESKQWEINSARLDQTIYEKDRTISELNDKIQQSESKIQLGGQNEQQMRDEINKFEMQFQKMVEDNELLKGIVKEKEGANQEMKGKIKELELRGIEAYNEINSIKYSLQNIEENYNLSQQELHRTQSVLQQRMNEIIEYKKKYREAESNYQELLNDYNSNKSQVLELYDKIQLYEKEIQRLYSLLKERDSCLNECKSKLSKAELENQELQYRVNEMEEMNKEQKKELSKSMIFANNQIDGIQEQKSQQAKLKAENQRLQDKLNDLEDMYKKLQDKCSDFQQQIQKVSLENKQLKKTCEQATDLLQELTKLKESADKLSEKYQTCKEQNEEHELKNNQLSIEVEKEKGKSSALEFKLRQSEEQIKLLEERINELNDKVGKQQEGLRKGGDMEGEIEELKKKWENMGKVIKEKEELVSKMEKKIKALEKDSEELEHFKEREEIQNLREELSNSSPSNVLDKLRTELSNLKKENARLSAQLEILQQYESQSIALTKQLEEQSQEAQSLQSKFNDNMAQFERSNWMAAEIQRLTLVLDEKDKELQGFKSKYIENSELMKKLEDQLMMVFIVCAEMEALRSRLEEKEREIKESRRTGISRYRANKEKEKDNKDKETK